MDINSIVKELTLEEKAGLCSGADYWHTKAVERFNIPRAMMCDATHGLRKQLGDGDHMGIKESIKTVCFPTASALSASFDRNLLKHLGEMLGNECLSENIAMLLGPGINIKRSPLCGRNFEYFSEDPYLTGQMAAAYIQGIQSKGVASCPKHYVANDQETGRMVSDSQVDERTLNEIYLAGFETAVKQGKARSIMSAYNKVNGTYMSENKKLLTDILREKWGFDGFVVSDWGAVNNRVAGLQAGLDLDMPGGKGIQELKIIEAVKNGTLDINIVDNAVKNILTFVFNYMKPKPKINFFTLEQKHEMSADVEKECAVLLKNKNNILPLCKNKKIAFIGEFAKEPRYQGAGSSRVNTMYVTGACNAAEKANINISYAQGYTSKTSKPEQNLIDEAIKTARGVDIAVLFVGLTDAYEIEGIDRTSLDMPENQLALIKALVKVQRNIVIVLHGGSAMTMPWVDNVSAILHMHLGGDNVGTAAISLLFGDDNPSGKLSETYPIKLEDNPSYFNFPGEKNTVNYCEGVFVGYRYYDKKKMNVLFPFGHGLSYTSFLYSNIKLDKTFMNDDEILIVNCNIKNIGQVTGKEAVQLYVRNAEGSVNRPIRELKEFIKIELTPGEEKIISFKLDKRAFAYYEPLIQDFFVENGTFIIDIGSSSRDIRLNAQININSIKELPVVFTREMTIGNLMKNNKGNEFAQSVLKKIANQKKANNDSNDTAKHLGQDPKILMQRVMREMPMFSLVNHGILTDDELDEALNKLNS